MMHTSLKCMWNTCENKGLCGSHNYCTSFTWAFRKVNNNQSMDLEHNLIMKCILCHNDYVDIKILTMHTKFWKGLIACHKTNGITTMNKRLDVDHFAFVKKLTKDPNCIPLAKAPSDQEASKKRVHVSPSLIYVFFFSLVNSENMNQHKCISSMIS